MTAQKDSDRTALNPVNLDDTAYWGIVDKLAASVKMTFAQLKTALASATSITGDITASVVSGVATTTIGALKVVTGMFANAAVTYAKMQNVSATNRLLGRFTAGAGVVEEITPSATYFVTTAGTLNVLATMATDLAPVMKATDQSMTVTSLSDVTGMAPAVVSGGKYAFEFFILFIPTSTLSSNFPRLSISAPLGVMTWQATIYLNGTSTVDGGFRSYNGTANNQETPATGLLGNLTETHFARVTGYLTAGTAGTIQLRAYCPSAGTWTIKAGSWYRLTKLG